MTVVIGQSPKKSVRLLTKLLAWVPFPIRQALGTFCLMLSMKAPENSKYICTYDAAPFTPKYTRDEWESFILTEFEGYMFPVPEQYDALLTRMYGNYMQLPPEDQRVGHVSPAPEKVYPMPDK